MKIWKSEANPTSKSPDDTTDACFLDFLFEFAKAKAEEWRVTWQAVELTKDAARCILSHKTLPNNSSRCSDGRYFFPAAAMKDALSGDGALEFRELCEDFRVDFSHVLIYFTFKNVE